MKHNAQPSDYDQHFSQFMCCVFVWDRQYNLIGQGTKRSSTKAIQTFCNLPSFFPYFKTVLQVWVKKHQQDVQDLAGTLSYVYCTQFDSIGKHSFTACSLLIYYLISFIGKARLTLAKNPRPWEEIQRMKTVKRKTFLAMIMMMYLSNTHIPELSQSCKTFR